MYNVSAYFFYKTNKLIKTDEQNWEVWVAIESATSNGEKKVSGAELGRRLGISRQAVNDIVNERKDIKVGKLYAIAEALQVRVRDLFKE